MTPPSRQHPVDRTESTTATPTPAAPPQRPHARPGDTSHGPRHAEPTASAHTAAPTRGKDATGRSAPAPERSEADGRQAAEEQQAAEERADRAADRRHRLLLHGGRLMVGVVGLLLWQYASGRWVEEFFLSSPAAVAERLLDLVRTGALWPHLTVTLTEFGIGLTIGFVLGTVLGLGLAYSGIVGQWFHPYVMAFYSLPRVALAPLFIVWFGIGLTSKVIMVVTMVIFVILYNVHEGVRNIDPDLMDMAKGFRAPRRALLRWVVLPALVPWLLTGLRLAVGLALIGAVIAELVGSSEGLGHYIKLSSNLLDITGVFAGLAVITTIAMVFDQAVGLLGRRLLRYRSASQNR